MSTSPIDDAQQFLAQEQSAEQRALSVLRGATFTDCLKLCGLAPIRTVQTPDGKVMMIRGSDIYDRRTWTKFLSSIEQREEIYQLTEVGAQLARQYKAWLLTNYTQRYRTLSTKDELTWLEQVITLAVSRHILEQKYHAYTTKGIAAFADPRTAIEMGNLLMLNQMTREAARLIHHIMQDPTQATALIEHFYQEHLQQMEARALLMEARLPAPSDKLLGPFLFGAREGEGHDE